MTLSPSKHSNHHHPSKSYPKHKSRQHNPFSLSLLARMKPANQKSALAWNAKLASSKSP